MSDRHSPGGPSPGRVHHVAVVVRDMDEALAFYRDRLGLPVELVLPIESDGVTIAFLPVGESKVELVMPMDPSTGVARFLEGRGAEGPVAFIHPRSCHGVLVELIEAPGGPAWSTLGMESP